MTISESSCIGHLEIQHPKKQIDKIYNIIVRLAVSSEMGNSAITSQERHYIYQVFSDGHG